MKKKFLIDWMERQYPSALAESWDRTGMQIDCGKDTFECILTALEMTPEVLTEALETGADLVVVHHPLIFNPLERLRAGEPEHDMVMTCIRKGLSVFAAHTNADKSSRGPSDWFAALIGLQDVVPLAEEPGGLCKVAVFVPEGHLEAVRSAMGTAGAGTSGKYARCTFSTEGTGTFMPLEGADPYLGRIGALERVREHRIESIVACGMAQRVVEAARAVHPYEAMAYDIIPLRNRGESTGLGRRGRLKAPISLGTLMDLIRTGLGGPGMRYVGDPDCMVETVGVCTGSGSDLVGRAIQLGLDCYLTGDVKYHDAQKARMAGLCLVDVGHFESEDPFKRCLAMALRDAAAKAGSPCRILVSEAAVNPFRFHR